jgi:hypothetical protein
MSLPTPEKEWVTASKVNIASVSHGTTNAFESPNCADALWQAKNALVTLASNAWSVTRSYVYLGSTTNTDQITDYTTISGDPAGSALGTWFQMTQPATGAQVVFACTLFGVNQFNLRVVYSPGGLFTGGSSVAIPTATDSVSLTAGTTFLGTFSVSAVSFIVHVLQSNDGKNTRVLFHQSGSNKALALWIFGQAGSPVAGWTNPNMAAYQDCNGSRTSPATIGGLFQYRTSIWKAQGPTGAMALTGAVDGSATGVNTSVLDDTGFIKNKISTQWHIQTMTLERIPSSDTQAGWHGRCVDLWWSGLFGSVGDNQIKTIPDPIASSNKTFLAIYEMVIPWAGVAISGVSDETGSFFTPEATTITTAATTVVSPATFSTPIPALASQIFPSGETLQVTTGTLQTLPSSRWYYLVSNRTATTNGQSLLFAIKTLLDASLAGTAWTVVINKVGTTYRIQLSHNNGSSRTITFSASFALALGFASTSVVVATATTVTADYPSYWWWTPDMPVSMTGPTIFDHSLNFGVPVSAGASQRSSDMTAAYVQNGIQYDAEFMFSAVQFYYKIRPHGTYPNQDFETWWKNGPCKGRRFLFWRNRDNATGSNAPSAGGSSPYRYIEYAPQEDLRGVLPAKPTAPPNLVYWDVTLKCWITDNGEAVLSV